MYNAQDLKHTLPKKMKFWMTVAKKLFEGISLNKDLFFETRAHNFDKQPWRRFVKPEKQIFHTIIFQPGPEEEAEKDLEGSVVSKQEPEYEWALFKPFITYVRGMIICTSIYGSLLTAELRDAIQRIKNEYGSRTNTKESGL